MADKDCYIALLEKKLAELSGIKIDQIRKNQFANAADEARSIKEMSDYVASITVQKSGVAQAGKVDPTINTVFELVKKELAGAELYSLPSMQYSYDALEPHISGTIMEIHHTKHHQAYINNLKAAAAKLEEAKAANDTASMNALLPAIKFNGGGHLNHTIFWTNMTPNADPTPPEPLLGAINRDFGSFDNFRSQFSTASVGVKGSGWGWLGYCPQSGKLKVATCQNQDPLEIQHGLLPLLGLDVWEHAYYLQYRNLRADYVKAFFNVINWRDVNRRYEDACKRAGK